MLGWELLQLPLYTIWHEADAGAIAFAVAHCTLGDAVIGTAALFLALISLRAQNVAAWPWSRVALVATGIGLVYTGVSEWMNTSIRQSWQYSLLMPVVELGNVVIGVSPIVQWLLLPSIALYGARRMGT